MKSRITEYPYTVAALAVLCDVSTESVRRAIQREGKLFGVSVEYIRNANKSGSPIYISQRTYERLQRKVLRDNL